MATKRVYTYPFTMTRVIDGDTIEGYADMGFYTKRLVSVRLLGVKQGQKKKQGFL
jgi:endonuclease YncB( thermonuclease family)